MKKNSIVFHFSFFTFHFLLLGGLVFFFLTPSSLPQLASGSDVLSVIFGDAREVISRAAVQKADSYFHGGIDMDGADHDDDEEHGGLCRHDSASRDAPAPEENRNSTTIHYSLFTIHSLPDPWHWIDSRIRAPQEHRHLDGAKAVELLPWFWAAVKADPHNAEAWSVTWYTASHVMKDKELAARVLAEAKARNPDSIEIAFTEGRALYDGGKGDVAAAEKAFERARALGDAKCGGDVSKLTVREEEAYRFAGNYLKSMKEKSK